MIDIETLVFDAVYPFIESLVPEGGFVSEYVPAPKVLPHVYLAEIDNTPDRRTADTGMREWSSIVSYESNVYARSKTECRAIQSALDAAMVGTLGFNKMQGQFVPNLADRNIYRIVARYSRGVTHSGDLYRPT